ncbi:hypothetical protein ASPZODRAFT_147994 [Penicilliopsis zonata CBS 506.65]|uniref:Zn(2)-C6 fungal-type domain-containing protein n=1 Tax=Penicilliopsis zonata CBS 506.65 TaxID=1073090 RepID=A0A1L9STD8_9EURO|nr:hypothetical protein ASPZODRAFT_147994 [Penicilliopsis zonata CBS 506.65]OJJ50485.1 hypothetical protein ASPZODRAFT_147994 [Penicilliopsis zonata CBS 506.65]
MPPSARPGGKKRLPTSCQACRTRKIRCSRDARPCQTCVGRGLTAKDCVYLGQPRLSSERPSAGNNDSRGHHELLARIRKLEEMLQRQSAPSAAPSSASFTGGLVSPQRTPSATGSMASMPEADGAGAGARAGIRSLTGVELGTTSPILANAGSLQTFPSGYVRYVPLASQWNSVGAENSTTDHPQQNLDAEVPEEEDDLQIPLVRNGSVTRAELLAILPPSRYCDSLKSVYFRVFSPLFHILHDLTFEAEYQQFCHDASSVSLSWLALLFTLLSIAVTALEDNDPLLADLGREKTVSRNIKVLSSRYRSAAMRCLAADGVIVHHSINSLQALVLISYARLHRGLSIWTLLGFTHHVAIAMGCHIDPDRFFLGPIEREERRRAWAGLMILYIRQEAAVGSLDQRFLMQDVKLPADINDVDLLTGTATTTSTSTDSIDPDQCDDSPTQMTYLLLKFRLYKVSSLIHDSLFGFSYHRLMTTAQLENEIMTILKAVNARYRLDTRTEPLPSHHLANLNILYSSVHQLFLLLLRPQLCRYFQGEITDETCAARLKCAASAKASLTIYQTMFECPEFSPYKWYNSGLGSFHAFHAAIVLAVILMNLESPSEYQDIKAILTHALDTFAALSLRSQFCSKAVPVLRRIM